MTNVDMARLFENAFPNTLDTTVRWHVDGKDKKHSELKARGTKDAGKWEGPQSFVVTGNIRIPYHGQY